MPHPEPSQVPLVSYLWVTGLSLLSAVAGYLSRYLSKRPPRNPLLYLALDISYALLAGLTTYFFAQSAHLDEMTAIVMVSIGSHMGARLMFTLQNVVAKQIRANALLHEDE